MKSGINIILLLNVEQTEFVILVRDHIFRPRGRLNLTPPTTKWNLRVKKKKKKKTNLNHTKKNRPIKSKNKINSHKTKISKTNKQRRERKKHK